MFPPVLFVSLGFTVVPAVVVGRVVVVVTKLGLVVTAVVSTFG